jgi:hypothetical protein
VELQFLEQGLWPVFSDQFGSEYRPTVEFAIQQLKLFFEGGSVDERAADIYASYLHYVLDPPRYEK